MGSDVRATDREPGTQLPTLAATLFECIKERLDELIRLLSFGIYFFGFTDHCYVPVQESMHSMTRKSYSSDLMFCVLKYLRH